MDIYNKQSRNEQESLQKGGKGEDRPKAFCLNFVFGWAAFWRVMANASKDCSTLLQHSATHWLHFCWLDAYPQNQLSTAAERYSILCQKGGEFVHFLIDYENVHNLGMRGTEYLLPSDHVIVFYSESSPAMESRYLNDIQNSGCVYEVCKLLTKRKNGLDFYIATKVGALFGAECCKNAVLVSNDAGFQAIRDFWQERSGTKHRVALSESIEQGIITAGENSERSRLIRAGRKAIDIGQFYAAYQEDLRLQQVLRDAFDGTAYIDCLPDIQDILKSETSPKGIYLNSLRHFGRKTGQEIYRMIKTCTNF